MEHYAIYGGPDPNQLARLEPSMYEMLRGSSWRIHIWSNIAKYCQIPNSIPNCANAHPYTVGIYVISLDSLFLSTLLSVRAVLLSLMDDGILQYDEDNYMKSRCHQCQAGWVWGEGWCTGTQ